MSLCELCQKLEGLSIVKIRAALPKGVAENDHGSRKLKERPCLRIWITEGESRRLGWRQKLWSEVTETDVVEDCCFQ